MPIDFQFQNKLRVMVEILRSLLLALSLWFTFSINLFTFRVTLTADTCHWGCHTHCDCVLLLSSDLLNANMNILLCYCYRIKSTLCFSPAISNKHLTKMASEDTTPPVDKKTGQKPGRFVAILIYNQI